MKAHFFSSLLATLIPGVLASTCMTFGQAAPAQSELNYQELANQALSRHGMVGNSPDTFSFDAYCNKKFVHLEVGLFDLYMERDAFANMADAQRAFQIAGSLAHLQKDFLKWADPLGASRAKETEISEDLVKFLKKPKLKAAVEAMAKPITGVGVEGEDRALDLWTVLTIKPERLETFRSLATFMQTDGGLGLERGRKPEKMVLYPSRERYVEVIALAGWARPEARGNMWSEGILTWTNFYVNDWRFMAMAFSPAHPTKDTYKQSDPMEQRIPTGLKQQMTQLASLGLLDNLFGGRIPPGVAGGLSLNLVVDQFNECNTRVDGDLRERRKEAREMFVPGGQSEGGVLPPNLADSRWRDSQGKDHFISILKNSQKVGAADVPRKDRKDKVRYFQLIADDEVEKMVTAAPVLGTQSAGLGKIPSQFYGDRLEFARSYSSCFLYWLREKGGGKKAPESQAKFAALIKDLATTKELDAGGIVAADPANIFEDLFKKHYGVPLSSPDLDPKSSLEGAFLHWLPKAR